MQRLLVIATLYALLSACASPAPVTEQAAAPEPAATAPSAEETAKPPERAFPDDSLHALLVAEFALRRRSYDVALENYLAQAPLLRDPGVSAHTTHLAQFMQQEQDALESVQLWVELEPDNAEANNTLASLLVRQGRTLEALPHMAVVQRHGIDAPFPTLLSGFELLNEERKAELVQGINDLATEFPNNEQLLLTQAIVHAEFDQYQQALDKLDILFESNPYQTQAVLLETKIRLTMKDKHPYKHLNEALEKDPDNKTLRLQYARLLSTHDMSAARKQFEILSAQSPRDGDLLLSLALINRETGDDIAARAYLRQLLALEQRLNEAHFYLGRIAEDENDLETAVSEYMQVEESREFLSANSHIGQILVGNGQVQECHIWFARQREANPQRSEPLFGLEADILTQAGEGELAMQVLNQGLQEFPGATNLLYARSLLGEQQNDLALMESDLRAIIAREPENATALNALGYTLANRTERYDEAYELISRALALQPDEPAILDSMGWILYLNGQHEEALDYLTRAYAVFPDPEVAAHLGEVLWVSGNTSAARDVWRSALLKDPEHEVLLATMKRFGVSALADSPAPAQP